jgi:hypothetical protein
MNLNYFQGKKMKNKLGLVLATALLSTAALAEGPKVKIELRSEVNKQTSDVESDANDENNEDEDMLFKVPYVRLDVKVKVNDSLSYQVKFRLNKEYKDRESGGATSVDTDSIPKAVDYAYIDHKISDSI